MRRTIRSTGVLVLVLGALALVGCSAEGTVSGAQQATIDQADPICEEAQRKIGDKLGDDPAVETQALKTATDQLLAISAPSENVTTWTIFVQSVNNLWLNMFDVSEALLVNDRTRAATALDVAGSNNEFIIDAATDYKTEECKKGFAEDGTQLKS